MFIPTKYKLKDGSIYWHKLYFDIVPNWMTKYSPPLGTYNYAGYAYRPWEYIEDIYLQVKWFIQRGSRGYADCDVWSIDWYLCGWMPKALADLKNNMHGHPIGLSEKMWRERLDRMINAFETARKIQKYDYKTPEEASAHIRQFRKDFTIFRNHFFSLWD